jgi:hypothetical protein
MKVPDEVDLFNYTDTEWAAIETAAQVARRGPLPDSVREALLTTGRRYRWLLTQPKLVGMFTDGEKLLSQFEEFRRTAIIYAEKYLENESSSVELQSRLEERLALVHSDIETLYWFAKDRIWPNMVWFAGAGSISHG